MKTNLLAKLSVPAAMLMPLAAAAAQQPPNIIVVVMDDMGYGDIGTTGAIGTETPNLDRMAAEGMRFTRFYAAQAVCTASRAGLLTGCYPNRIGYHGAMGPASRLGLAENEETIADVLKKKGYATAAYGKWHIGHLPQFLPLRHGFDDYYGIPYSNDMWPHHPTRKYPDLPLIEGEKTIELNPDQSRFTTDFTNRALRFIDTNKNKPFFIYLAHPMPHVPLAVSPKFKGKSRQGLYGDVIMEIDWSVGEILKKLKQEKLDENTLVVVTSDNGPWLNYGNHAGSAGGLRQGKGTSFEGGQRVPCIMQWKGAIPAGTICNKLASAIDLLPTFAHIAGAPLPPLKIDGVSILPLLKNEPGANPRDRFCYYYRKNNLEAVTDGNFKLIFPHPHRSYEGFAPGADGKPGALTESAKLETPLLFDLRRDPGERYNVIEQYPEIRAKLEHIAAAMRDDLGDDLTGIPGKNIRPRASAK